MVERIPRGIGSRCGVKISSPRIQLQLLENLSDMAMPEDRVGGQIVRHRNEVGARGRFLARARDAGLRIGNDSLLAIDDVRSQQRSQRKNHRSGIAAGIGHQRGARQAVAIQFGKAVDRLLHELGRGDRIRILEAIDGAVLRLMQSPGAAEINHAHPAGDRLRHQRARHFVRRGQKQQFDFSALQFSPGPGLQWDIRRCRRWRDTCLPDSLLAASPER